MLLCLLMVGRMLLYRTTHPAPTPQPTPDSTQTPVSPSNPDQPGSDPTKPGQTNPSQTNPSQTSEEEPGTLVFDETALRDLVWNALPVQPDALTVAVSDNGELAASAAISKKTLTDSGLVTGGLRTMLIFLPEQCKLYAAWQPAVVDGSIDLSPVTMEVAGVPVPDQAVNSVTEMVEAAIAQQLKEWGVTVTSLRCESGQLVVQNSENGDTSQNNQENNNSTPRSGGGNTTQSSGNGE